MKHIKWYILPLFFFGFIYFMFFNQIFGWIEYKSTTENRNLAQFPKMDIQHLDKYPVTFDNYLQDNYAFRVPFLDVYHNLMYQMGVSPDIDKVIIGKSGQLFLGERDVDVFKGRNFFNRERLDSLESVWKEKKSVLATKKTSFYWLIAPFKLHIYPEDLPNGLMERVENRTLVVKKRLDEKFPNLVVYPIEELKKHRAKAYYKYDNHWTQKGSFYGYQALMKAIAKDDASIKYLSESDVDWKIDSADRHDLLNYIGKTGELSEFVPFAKVHNNQAEKADKFGFKAPKSFPYPWNYENYFKNKTPLNKKKILVITDSFGSALYSFISASFSESLFIFENWEYSIRMNIIETYQPDIVVFVTMETFIDNWIDYPAVIK